MNAAAIHSAVRVFCVVLGVALLAVSLVAAVAPRVRDAFRRMGADRPLRAAAWALFALVAIDCGATKPVRNHGADAGLAVVYVGTEYDGTNDVSAVEVKFTGANVTAATPVSVRNGETEQWRELAKIGATVTSDLATNLLAFAVSGNVSTNRYWWVGFDTPAVVVESEGITITNFVASSQSVFIEWTCDDPNATEFAIQRKPLFAPPGAPWEVVGVTSSLAFLYQGFTVGESWKWRVTATYQEGD